MIRSTQRFIGGTMLAISAGFLALTPAAFAAADDDALPQARLDVAGADFTSLKSVAHLKNKVRHAAFEICSPDWDGRRLMTTDETRCYNTALHSGLAQIESRRRDALCQTPVNMAAAQPDNRPGH
jgi:UrcA family protein